MRNIIIVLIVTLLLSSCGAKRVTKKEITTNYTNITFTPKESEQLLSESFTLSVEPIGAKDLNLEVAETIMRDGGYEKRYSTSTDLFEDINKLSRSQRRKIENYLKTVEFIGKLYEENHFDQYVQNALLEKTHNEYLLGEPFGYNGTEKYQNSGEDSYYSAYYEDFNPYRLNNRYLSIFRLKFINTGSEINEVNIDNFQITNNLEQLYPFKIEYFENNEEVDSEKMKFIYRMNMPDNLVVTPSQSVVKYISTPAINPMSNDITISYIKDNSVINYPFELHAERVVDKISLSIYYLNYNKRVYGPADFIAYVVDLGDKSVFPLRSNVIHLNEEEAMSPITVYMILIPVSGKKEFHKTVITPSDYKSKSNDIKFGKSKKDYNELY